MNEQLMAAIPYSVADLAANKQGHLSEAQKLRLERDFAESVNMGKKIAVGLWAAAALLVVLVIVVGPPAELTARIAKTSFRKQPDALRWAVFGFSSVAIVAAGLCSLFVLIGRAGRRNMRSGLPVYSVEGMAEKSSYEGWYTLKVNDREFVYSEPNERVYDAFEAGSSYRIYYIFNTANIIVSAERVE